MEDLSIYKRDYQDDGGAEYDDPHSYMRDASVHRHEITIRNAVQLLYVSYWKNTAFALRSSSSGNSMRMQATFNLQYSTPYVISFWYKAPVDDPVGDQDFRIL